MHYGEPVLLTDGSNTIMHNSLNLITNHAHVKGRPNRTMKQIEKEKRIAYQNKIFSNVMKETEEHAEYKLVPVKCTFGGRFIKSVQELLDDAKGKTIITSPQLTASKKARLKEIETEKQIEQQKRIEEEKKQIEQQKRIEEEKKQIEQVKIKIAQAKSALNSYNYNYAATIASKKAIAIEDIKIEIQNQFDAVPLKAIASKKARLKEIEKKLEEINNELEDIKIEKEYMESELECSKSALNAYNYAAIGDRKPVTQSEIQIQSDSTSQFVKTSQYKIISRRKNAAALKYYIDKEREWDMKENLDKQKISISIY